MSGALIPGTGTVPSMTRIDSHDLGLSWVMDDVMERACHALRGDDGRVWLIDPARDDEALAAAAALRPPGGGGGGRAGRGRAAARRAAAGPPHPRLRRDRRRPRGAASARARHAARRAVR